jgi:hypothetical protein
MPPNGRAIFLANCATCHGEDGRGMRTPAEVGFDLPMPNSPIALSRRAKPMPIGRSIHQGRATPRLPRIMPAFEDALSDDEIDAVIGYLRTFCTDPRWVRGEFNFALGCLPRRRSPKTSWSGRTHRFAIAERHRIAVRIEKRVGPTGQLEVNLPSRASMAARARQEFRRRRYRRCVEAEHHRRCRFRHDLQPARRSVLPTGSERKRLGHRLAWRSKRTRCSGRCCPTISCCRAGVRVFPLRKALTQEVGINLNIQKDVCDEAAMAAPSRRAGIGGRQEMASGAKTEWDLVPQMQVSLSTCSTCCSAPAIASR